ncbi:MAG: NUDIX domain-containing protein [Planctomycetes bacterium]|nr:NUDIX domain-containing protein [Planctomycetota bacterium]
MTRIHVVDRAAFFGGGWPQGFVPMAGAAASQWLAAAYAHGRFEDRPTAEANPAWKQWIPYCVLCCGQPGPSGTVREPGVLTVRRTRGQSEARLHGAWSIGLGGHIEPDDDGDAQAGAESFFAQALARELHEELDLRQFDLPRPRFLGLLNDDSTEVGRVHAGLVYRVDLPLRCTEANERVRIGEISKMHGGFTHLVEFADLWQNPTQFETWSQILVRAGVVGATDGCSSSAARAQNG